MPSNETDLNFVAHGCLRFTTSYCDNRHSHRLDGLDHLRHYHRHH